MAQRAGRAIRDMQNYREPEFKATTTPDGLHFVPTIVFGAFALRDLPDELRQLDLAAPGPCEPSRTWTSY